MTTEEIKEGNKLLWEFMGCGDESIDDHPYYTPDYSWEWLMPVVQKIESLDAGRGAYTVEQEGVYCRICFKDETDCVISEFSTESKIKSTWLAVVEFIKWYNKYENN